MPPSVRPLDLALRGCVGITHVCALIAGAVLLSLPLLLFLLQLFNALLQDVGPEVALKVRQLLGAGQSVLRGLLEDVLKETKKRRNIDLVSFDQMEEM